MKTAIKFTVFCFLLSITTIAFAYDGPVDMVGGAITDAANQTFTSLNAVAYTLFMSLALLQFVLKMVKLLSNGESDIGAILGKVAMTITWVGVVFWLLAPVGAGHNNGSDIIQKFVDYFIAWAGTFSGGSGGTAFSAADIFNVGLFATNNITTSVIAAATGSVANAVTTVVMPATAIFAALMLVLMNFFVLVSCAYIAVKVFMVKVELAIVLAVSPISFAFLGLDALRDQGIAPFKYGIAVMYRIVILGTIVGAMKIVSDNLVTVLATKVAGGGMTDIWTPLLAAIFGYILIAFVAYKSDSIASSLASGSTQMGSGDLASAVAAGVAAGAVVTSGGAAAMSAASKTGGSMSDAIKAMRNESLGIKNAGSSGNGASGGGGSGFRGLNSVIGDAPPPFPKEPDRTAQEVNAMAPKSDVSKTSDSGNSASSANPTSNSASNPGNAANAGISDGGAGASDLSKQVSNFVEQLQKQSGGSNKLGVRDRLTALNDNISRESAATHVSINPHHHD